MKDNKTVIIIIIFLALVFIGVVFLFNNKQSTQEKTKIDIILEKLENTSSMQYLRQMYNFDIDVTEEEIKFNMDGNINKKEIKYTYEVEYTDENLKMIVDRNNIIDTEIFLGLVDAIFQNYGYEPNSTDFLYTSSEYIKNKMGIIVIEDDKKYEYEIDYSKKHDIPKDTGYISYERLDKEGYINKLKTHDYFEIKEGDIFVFKSSTQVSTTSSMAVYIVELGDSDENTYKTILSFASAVMSKLNYNNFIKEFTSLKKINFENIIVETNYKPSGYEEFNFDEEFGLTKLIYKSPVSFELPPITPNPSPVN